MTIGSAGKTFSVTGWRLGWSIGPKYLISCLHVVHQNVNHSCPTPLQVTRFFHPRCVCQEVSATTGVCLFIHINISARYLENLVTDFDKIVCHNSLCSEEASMSLFSFDSVSEGIISYHSRLEQQCLYHRSRSKNCGSILTSSYTILVA